MNKMFFRSALLLFSSMVLFACSDDDNNDKGNPIQPEFTPNGAYVLSSGGKGNNAATIAYYSMDTKEATQHVFTSANGINLGDTGESMIAYGSKIYVAVYNSGIIYVLDNNCKILNTIVAAEGEDKLQPREMDAANGKVYVSLYDGYLARIDTTTMTIDKRIAVGPNPEGVKVANSKVYVADSGGQNSANGYNNTVSVVDLNLTTVKTITVGMNPQEFATDKYNNLYLVSRGNYKTDDTKVPNKLQQINTATDEVTILDEDRTFTMYPNGDKIYLINKVYVNSLPTTTIACYNIQTKTVTDESFITDDTTISDISFVETEPVSGDIYVAAANKKNNGDVYIFSSEGKFQRKFDTGSSYPMGIAFIQK